MYDNYIILSQNESIVRFVRENITFSQELIAEREIDESHVLAPGLIIDARLMSEQIISILQKKRQLLKNKVLFLLEMDISDDHKNFIYSYSEEILLFPCSKEILKKTFKKFLEKSIPVEKYDFIHSCYSEPEELLLNGFIGTSENVKKLNQNISVSAKVKTPILLTGESGTGKSTAAYILHKMSERQNKPFISINAANLTENFFDSVVFGTDKGAYTDAEPMDGFLRRCDGGTLFIDEIGELPLHLQSKLHLFLDQGIFYHAGNDKMQKADVRLIFATNENLKVKIMEGEFRRDFYYRISENHIHFPSLRDRKEDIPLLAKATASKRGKLLTDECIQKLMEYYWPGNVRELQGCVENACFMTSGDIITARDLRVEFNTLV